MGVASTLGPAAIGGGLGGVSRFAGQTLPTQQLLRMMQEVGFGSITFEVAGGQPDFARPYRTVRTLKLREFAAPNRPPGNFPLRLEHRMLLERLAQLPDGTRVRVKLMHGLPGASIDLEEDRAA